MDIIDIVKESLYYPLTNYQNWLILALLCLINEIITQLILPTDYGIIGSILIIIISIILGGYALSIIRSTINHQNMIPSFNPVANFIDGIKNFIVELVYMIVPGILTAIIAYPLGLYDYLYQFLNAVSDIASTSAIASSSNPTAILNYIPQEVLNGLVISSIGLVIIGFVLLIIFSILAQAGIGRLAQSDDILSSINFIESYNKISSVGIVKFVASLILLYIIIFVLAIIGAFIDMIPYVGYYITAFILASYILLVTSRCVGLLYLE